MGSRRGVVVIVGLAAAAVLPAGGADAGAATASVSYSGTRGHAIYSSFVIRGPKVVGLFAGGVCLPNVSLVEQGTDPPLARRADGGFRYVTSRPGYKVTLEATPVANDRFRVAFTLVNKRARSQCAYRVIARRTPVGR